MELASKGNLKWIIKSFDGTTAENNKKLLSSEKCSNHAYVIMMQSLANIDPFCLTVFGTDNKFTAEQFQSRWEFMENGGRKNGITILGYLSYNHTRLLSNKIHYTFASMDKDLHPGMQTALMKP